MPTQPGPINDPQEEALLEFQRTWRATLVCPGIDPRHQPSAQGTQVTLAAMKARWALPCRLGHTTSPTGALDAQPLAQLYHMH